MLRKVQLEHKLDIIGLFDEISFDTLKLSPSIVVELTGTPELNQLHIITESKKITFSKMALLVFLAMVPEIS